ncbi:MAG: TetR/AcrR family transcriptional regulator [Candidatus Rokuibacteriota bacterium]
MVRPRQFDPADVDDALLGVFWSRGYAGTSIEELTQATGLLRGSLYAAYGSKEDMFRAATRRYVADLAAALATDKTGLDGVQHVLDTVVRLTVRDPDRRGCVILNAIPEAHVLSPEMREELQDGLRSMQALLRARLREAQAETGRADLDVDPLVAMLFAASVAIRVLGRAGQERRLLQNIARGAIEAARRCFDKPRKD